jgi:hypothetical protein
LDSLADNSKYHLAYIPDQDDATLVELVESALALRWLA